MTTAASSSRAPAAPDSTPGERVVYDTVAMTWRIEQPADGTVQLRKNMLSGHILYMMGDVDGNRNDFCSGRYNRRDELIGGQYWCAAAPPSTPRTRPRVRSCPGARGGAPEENFGPKRHLHAKNTCPTDVLHLVRKLSSRPARKSGHTDMYEL